MKDRLPPIDFAAIAAAALASAARLVPQWLEGGRRVGHEWQAKNPTRGDRSAGSFSVNLNTGIWADFASGDKGGDLISLYAYLRHGGRQAEAALVLAQQLGVRTDTEAAPPPKAADRRTLWEPVVPVPEGAPPVPVAHVKRGRPERTWEYRDAAGRLLGYVYRFRTSDGGKEILPIVWARHADTGEQAWRWMQWAVPRPLYGLARLRPDRPVLVVEGEKCADAAHEQLGALFDVITWSGGGKAVDKADWSPLSGRRVVIWPDADAQRDKAGELLPESRQPGIVAAEAVSERLQALGCEVRIVELAAPGEEPGGWDIADEIEAGATVEDLRARLARLRAPGAPAAAETAPDPSRAARAGVEEAPAAVDEEGEARWRGALLRRRGEFVACLANVATILKRDPAWRGVIAFDEFSTRTMRRAPLPGREGDDAPAEAEWTDTDTSRATMWLTEVYGITAARETVDEAVELVARDNAYHPVRAYLAGLAWDGTARIDHWLADYLGVPRTEYSVRVARWFLIAMVARVMQPGRKFDYCLVLEGAQGLRKSTALRMIAGDWFSDTELDLTNKDALSAIRGKWLHEFSEMGSIARAESTRQKSFLSRNVDEFRPHYARREIKVPRQLVFAGTTNDRQWQKDLTGGRRFWPVEIKGEIDVDGLASVRDQLFAEAVHRYEQHERFWPTADEQRQLFDPEQLARETEDSFFDLVHDWLEHLARGEFTLADVLQEALKLDAGRMTRDVQTRVGILLQKFQCRRVERRNGVSRFVYLVPDWSDYAKARTERAQVASSDGDMPL